MQFLSIAVDVQGGNVVKPYIEGKTFTTLVDKGNSICSHFNFKVVPNGIFVDADGTIRFLKQSFKITEPEHVAAVEKLISGDVEYIYISDSKPVDTGSNQQLAESKYRLAMEFLNKGQKEDALRELDEALVLDPDNFVIRKQRWYIRYPEKFYPVIDSGWQKQQLQKELSQ